jgi:hypothetical protein
VYFPVLDSFKEKRNYIEKIAFQLNIDMLNPFKLLNKYYGNSE